MRLYTLPINQMSFIPDKTIHIRKSKIVTKKLCTFLREKVTFSRLIFLVGKELVYGIYCLKFNMLSQL